MDVGGIGRATTNISITAGLGVAGTHKDMALFTNYM